MIGRTVAVFVCASAMPGIAQNVPDADSLFRAGRFPEARAAYEAAARRTPSAITRRRLGQLALWENRLDAASDLLTQAARADSNDRESVEALAEVRYRQARFPEAAALVTRLNRRAFAAKLAAMESPSHVTVPADGARIPFAQGTVLPVLEVEVNGERAHFLLDTGAGETVIDPVFADRVRARRFGVDSAAYAGGQTATFEHAAVDSIRLGGALITGLPVRLLSTRAYAVAAGGLTVSGIIGTVLLSQFRATIDFGGNALLLARRQQAGPVPAGAVSVPFWLLGDHFVTVKADANGVATLLVFDTGLAMPGGGIVPSTSLLTEAKVNVDGPAVSGVGGGGRVNVTPIEFPRLTIGSLSRTRVAGVAGAFPPQLETRFGVRIGGLVSHGFFSGQRVTLDFDSMRLAVEESAPEPSAPSTPQQSAAGPAVDVPADTLSARALRVVQHLRQKEYDKLNSLWSASLRERLTPERLGAAWEGLVASVGPVSDVGAPQLTLATRAVRTVVQFGRIGIPVEIVFDQQGLVGGVRMGG